MKWKFWKIDTSKDETTIQIDRTREGITSFLVKAQTSDKALEIMEKLKAKTKNE